MKKTKISAVNTYLPENIISSTEVEKRINQHGKYIPDGSIERLFGVKERRFAHAEEQVSDLACKAARPIVESTGKDNIDCLIFAAACSDLIEPATANIIQAKLGLDCPVFDVKNACNSFVNAIQIASAFIENGTYNNVLITCGEKLSNAINFQNKNNEEVKKRLAAFSLGDAGAAMLLKPSEDESGIIYQKFKTVGKHWELCTIAGGGSMHPFDSTKNYFEGKTTELAQVIIKESSGFLLQCLYESGWKLEDIQLIFTHQVSAKTFETMAAYMGIDINKFVNVFEHFGNTAAASIPLSMHKAIESKRVKKGDKVMVLGLAAGVSISIQLIIW